MVNNTSVLFYKFAIYIDFLFSYIAGIKINIKNNEKAIKNTQVIIEIIKIALFLLKTPIINPKIATINNSNKFIVKLNYISPVLE